MAKKFKNLSKKQKNKKTKKKYKGVSSKDVRKRYRKAKRQWEKLKREGKDKKAKKAFKRMKMSRNEVKRREQKQYEKYRSDISMEQYNEKYNLLSPSQQKMIDSMVAEYDPDMIKKFGIGPENMKRLWKEAKKAAKEKYGKEADRLDEDYGDRLQGDVRKIQQELKRAQRDLETALEENNSYAAEIIKAEQRGLGDSLREATSRYETHVQNKKDYLEKQISDMQEKLDTGLGRLSEDETTKLRQIEREFTRALDNLQENASQMGITFSSKRFDEEEYLGETTEEQKMLTQRAAQRGREDLQSIYGQEAQEWQQRLTADELQDMAAEYGVDMRSMIQQVERKIGSQAASSILPAGTSQYLIGDQTGSVNWETQQQAKKAKQQYGDIAQGLADQFTGYYGSDAFQQKFGKAFDSAAADFTLDSWEGVYGTGKRAYERGKEDIKQEKKDYRQEYYDIRREDTNPNI